MTGILTNVVVEAAAPAAAIVVTGVGVVVTALNGWRATRRATEALDELAEAQKRLGRGKGWSDPETVLGITKGTPRLFFYLENPEVRSLYSQLSDAESVPKSRDLEHQTDRGFSLRISGHGASIGGKRDRTSKIHTTFQPESDLNRMYVAIERKLIDDGELTAVDLLEGFDTAPLASLDRLVSRFERDGFKVPPDAIVSIREAWREHQERQGAERLSNLTGYVAVRADYEASFAQGGGLILQAPVGSAQNASVSVYCEDKSLRNSTRTAIAPGAGIRATCIGKVIRWNEIEHKLLILPIAIF